LNFEYDVNIVNGIKGCGYGARWNQELLQWIVSVDSWSKPKIIDVIKRFKFKEKKQVTQEDINFSYECTESRFKELDKMCSDKDFEYTPRKYQVEALNYGLEKGSIINGDDVGLGKTFESIMYAEVSNSFPCLVVVPASVKWNWHEKWLEITKSKRSVAVIESKETKKHKNNWDADVVIINYDIIAKKAGKGATYKFDQLESIDWSMVIFDEAHFLKNSKSQRGKVSSKLASTGNRIIQLLTGTATMSRPVELWPLLVLINKHEAIAEDWFQYVTRYCGGYKGKFGWVTNGATKMIELNQKLRDLCYIRREKREVLEEMPPVTKQIIQMPISNEAKYNRAMTNFLEFVREEKGEEAMEKAMEAEHLVMLGTLRQLAIEGKLKAIEQYLKDWKEGGKKLVVFGLHAEPLEYLSKKFKSEIIGGSAKNKLECVKRFQENDDIFLFGNIQSAGTGVDGLQKVASNMLILELPWRPSDLTQVIGRLDRSGQKEPVTITYSLSDKTIDQDMWSMLEEKEHVTEAVNKGIDVRRNNSGMKTVARKLMRKIKKNEQDRIDS